MKRVLRTSVGHGRVPGLRTGTARAALAADTTDAEHQAALATFSASGAGRNG